MVEYKLPVNFEDGGGDWIGVYKVRLFLYH